MIRYITRWAARMINSENVNWQWRELAQRALEGADALLAAAKMST